MIVVSDTSVLTSLIHVGELALLQQLYGTILIPDAVHRELLRSHPHLPSFLESRTVTDRDLVERLAHELDLGEAEAITLAKETGAALLLIDEKLGRQAAAREGLRITGLMGVLLEAKHRGLVSSVRDFVTSLEDRAGFRVSEIVKREILIAAGE